MNLNTLWIIKTALGGMGAIFVLLGAIFTFWDSLLNNKNENINQWFRAKWEVINKSKWLQLPELVIRWFLKFPLFLVRIGSVPLLNDDRIGCFYFISCPTLLAVGSWLYWKSFWAAALSFGLFLFFSLMFLIMKKSHEAKANWLYRKVIIVIPIISIIIWTSTLLNLSINAAAPLMLLISPFYWFILALPIGLFAEKLRGGPTPIFVAISMLFFIGVSLGFTLTFLALLLGHQTAPGLYIPQTLQMLISNILFDGLTMMLTFIILEWTISQKTMFRVPMAIISDLIAAAILACGSLFFGLVFSRNALGLREIVNVLIARSPDGINFELSPEFWVMHTTFIPTLVYLILILLCWFAKAFLIPVRWFLGKGQEHKNPLILTACLCGVFAGIFGILYLAAGAAHEKAIQKIQAQAPIIMQP